MHFIEIEKRRKRNENETKTWVCAFRLCNRKVAPLVAGNTLIEGAPRREMRFHVSELETQGERVPLEMGLRSLGR